MHRNARVLIGQHGDDAWYWAVEVKGQASGKLDLGARLCTMRILLATILALSVAIAEDERILGVIEFPNSGAASAQEAFLTGMALLHNFEYDDAATAFQSAQRVDPGFGLAYWGEALTHYRPVWGREDREKGAEAVGRVGDGARLSAREAKYVEAAQALFGEGSREDRWQRYSAAMGDLHRSDPNDMEAAALYAVSMFGTTGRTRDTRTYMRIAAVAQEVYRRNPDHPGALHYLIHSFDDPVHAPLGLRFARRYSQVASSAPHAQHMPSHIFLALGMWDECVSSNTDSWNSSEARVKRLGLGSDSRGYHAMWWLQYAYLQQGRVDKARAWLDVIASDARDSGSKLARSHHAYLRSHLIIETQLWDSSLEPVDLEGVDARAWGAYALAEGMAAAKTGRSEEAREWLSRLQEYSAEHGDRSRSLPVAALELEGLLLLKADPEAGVSKLREATLKESETPYGYGPPFPAKPSYELLGETLLGLGRAGEAVEAFSESLLRAPRRALSVIGLRDAARAAGDSDTAARMDRELLSIREAGS